MFKRIAIAVLVVGFAGMLFIGCNPYEFDGRTDPGTDDPPIETPVVTYYDLSFDLNGGTGSFSKVSKTAGSPYTLPSTTPTKQGYIFTGWKAGNTIYQVGALFPVPTSNTIFVAQWQQEQIAAQTYTVKYNGNGGEPASVNGSSYEAGSTFAVSPIQTFVKQNHILSGWKYNNQTYTIGATFTMPAQPVIFLAQWTEEEPDPNQGTLNQRSMSEYVDETLLLQTIPSDETLTIHETDGTFAEQVKFQNSTFADGMALRLRIVYGIGSNGDTPYHFYDTQNIRWIQSVINKDGATSGFNGSIYNIADYARNLTSGVWSQTMSSYLSQNFRLRNAINGGAQYNGGIDNFGWGVNSNSADAWAVDLKTAAQYDEIARAITNIMAYGIDKGESIDDASCNIDHLGFTEKDKERILAYILNSVIGTNNISKDDARLASIKTNDTVVNGMVTSSTELTVEEHYYKAYRLLVENMIQEEINSSYFHYPVSYNPTGISVYKHTAEGNGLLVNKEIATADTDEYTEFNGPATMILKTSAVSVKNVKIDIDSAEQFQGSVTLRVVTNGVEVFKQTKGVWINSTATLFSFESTTSFNLGDYNGSNEKISITEGTDGKISSTFGNIGSSYIEITFGDSFANRSYTCELSELGVFTKN